MMQVYIVADISCSTSIYEGVGMMNQSPFGVGEVRPRLQLPPLLRGFRVHCSSISLRQLPCSFLQQGDGADDGGRSPAAPMQLHTGRVLTVQRARGPYSAPIKGNESAPLLGKDVKLNISRILAIETSKAMDRPHKQKPPSRQYARSGDWCGGEPKGESSDVGRRPALKRSD
jgi:hypothetical protein